MLLNYRCKYYFLNFVFLKKEKKRDSWLVTPVGIYSHVSSHVVGHIASHHCSVTSCITATGAGIEPLLL